jgi:hypothetical protein
MVQLYLYSPISLRSMVLKLLSTGTNLPPTFSDSYVEYENCLSTRSVSGKDAKFLHFLILHDADKSNSTLQATSRSG